MTSLPSRKLYIETYGCQMNVGDSEIVTSILADAGYTSTENVDEADVILLNTCSIRDNAEQRIWGRLVELRRYRKRKRTLLTGVIGCMAERLKEQLMQGEDAVDIVAGPDSYRDLPRLVAQGGGAHTLLSSEETYAEILPVRKEGVGAFISIMRGCDNYCSYCVVPYTRGRERSRDPHTILREARGLWASGYKEITLLGQNVNSYKPDFPDLLRAVAGISPDLRVRFATSHPKDLSDKLIETMAEVPNICRAIHLPAQSGSTRMLERMNRKYSREWYLERVAKIRSLIPDVTLSTDIIAGFSGETQEDHELTLSLMREVGFDSAFMFKYSERPGTLASRQMPDDIPDAVKTARLTQIIALQNELSAASNARDVGKTFEILVEGESKRSAAQLFGRTSGNKVVVFDRGDAQIGDCVTVAITGSSSATLLGVLCPTP